MAREIEEAIVRLNERKEAAGVYDDGSGGRHVDGGVFRRISSGFDLSFDEIQKLQPMIARRAAQGVAHGSHPALVAAGEFWDGLVVGLLLAESRTKAKVADV